MTPDGLATARLTLPAWAVVTPGRRAHVARVLALVEQWADALGTPAGERARWVRAVQYHDALRDAPEDALRALLPGDVRSAECLHGPAAALLAARDGEADAGVLAAVRHHTFGWAGWDLAGRVLYCADYLEPGRDFEREERAALAARFPLAPDEVLRAVARRRLRHVIESGWPLVPETVDWWNSLAASR